MSHGDIATVAIQYGNLPSMLSMNKADHASKLYGALVKRLRVEIDTLNHDNDPVAKFTPSMFCAMPDWLKTPDRGRGMNPHQRWLPGIAFWQGIIDTKNAATVVPGEFRSTGHDYRSDLASFVQVAYAFDDVTADQMERIEAKLRASEIERAENIAQGKVQSA